MLRTMFPILCGCVVALVISTGASAADEPRLAAAASPSTPLESSVRTCYYACDTWTLYTTQEACIENCTDPCERVCF
jgi:hypothetical protein